MGSRAGQESLKKQTELFCPCWESTTASSIKYAVLTNIYLKCSVTNSIRLCISKVIYAASTMIEVRGNQVFLCFSSFFVHWNVDLEVPCLNFDSRRRKKLWHI